MAGRDTSQRSLHRLTIQAFPTSLCRFVNPYSNKQCLEDCLGFAFILAFCNKNLDKLFPSGLFNLKGNDCNKPLRELRTEQRLS